MSPRLTNVATGMPRCRPAGVGPTSFNCVSCYRWNELSGQKSHAFKALMEVKKKKITGRLGLSHIVTTLSVGSLHDSCRLRTDGF